MVVEAAATCDGVPEWLVPRVARFSQPSHLLGTVVWEIARDPADGIIHGIEYGEMRETVVVFWLAVRRFRKFWKCFARARISHSQ